MLKQQKNGFQIKLYCCALVYYFTEGGQQFAIPFFPRDCFFGLRLNDMSFYRLQVFASCACHPRITSIGIGQQVYRCFSLILSSFSHFITLDSGVSSSGQLLDLLFCRTRLDSCMVSSQLRAFSWWSCQGSWLWRLFCCYFFFFLFFLRLFRFFLRCSSACLFR